MSIKIRCPGCQKSITAPAKYAGRTVKCPGCETKLKIPSQSAKAASQKAASQKAANQKAAAPKVAEQSPRSTVPKTKSKQASAKEQPAEKRQAFKISIPTKSESEDARPSDASMISRLAGRSGASNPGRIPISLIHYSLCRPLWPCLLALACCVGVVLAVMQMPSGKTKASSTSSSGSRPSVTFMDQAAKRSRIDPAPPRNGIRGATQPKAQPSGKLAKSEKEALGKIAMLILFPVGISLFYFYDRLRHFMRGDGNPGIVLAVNPTLVAVATDMSMDGEPHEAVKVFQTNMKTSQGASLEVGSVIGTIAQYSAPASNQGHFADFNPLPADLATKNEAYLSSLIDSFDREQYQQSINAIRRLPQPYHCGLFYVGGEGAAEEMPKGLFSKIRGIFKLK